MASFQKRGKTWQYTVSNYVDGKYKPIRKGGFKTKKEAQVAAIDVEQRLAKGTFRNVSDLTFYDYFVRWMETYKKPFIRPATYAQYETTSDMIKEYFSHTLLIDITKERYQRFLNDFAKHRTTATVKKLHIHIHAAIMHAVDDQLIPVPFTRNATVRGQGRTKTRDEKFLNYEEALLLMKRLHQKIEKDGRLTDYVLLISLLTGMRFGEVVGLTWSAIDVDAQTITVDRAWDYKHSIDFKNTKTNNVRVIHVDDYTIDLIKRLYAQHIKNEYQLLFFEPNSNTKVPGNRSCNLRLMKHCEALDINRITVHGLRHTHASILIYKGISIYYISERLGHSNIQMTLSVYAHLLKELKSNEVNKTVDTFKTITHKIV